MQLRWSRRSVLSLSQITPKAGMEQGARNMVSLLDTGLFVSSLCQIHISETERGPKEFLKLVNNLRHFLFPYSKAVSATDCNVISHRCQRLLTFSEDSSDGVLGICIVYPFLCSTILIIRKDFLRSNKFSCCNLSSLFLSTSQQA